MRELNKMKQEPVRAEQGRAIAEQIGAFAYLECSAKNKDVSILLDYLFPCSFIVSRVVLFRKEIIHPDSYAESCVLQGIREVFEKATQAALQQKKKKKSKCTIL